MESWKFALLQARAMLKISEAGRQGEDASKNQQVKP